MLSPKKSTTADLTATPLDRRRALRGMLGIASLPALAAAGWLVSASNEARAQTKPLMEVWKDPNCGCCKDWVKLMEEAGFSVQTYDTGNRAKRKQLGLPEKLGSCHTALVNGYVVEGHVPASAIKRLLVEKPAALGITVPGMPIGSPGMDGPEYGGRKDPFNVLLVSARGETRVWQVG
ncbi:MAG: DUF411 domain-containing protein [Burkholderiaceae bacterium]